MSLYTQGFKILPSLWGQQDFHIDLFCTSLQRLSNSNRCSFI